MKRACTDATGSNRTKLNAQAGNDQDVRQDPGTGKSRSTQQPIATVTPDNDRPTIGQPSSFFSPHQERTSQSIPNASPGQLSASQPVLRGLEAAESAHGSGNGQTDAPGSLALQAAGLTSCEQAARITDRPSQEQGSEPYMVQAALDKAYRSELSAWVASADLTGRARHQKAERKINAYLEKPAQQGRWINLSGLGLSTLPPLPADLVTLDVCLNELTALPAHLPQGLQELNVNNNKLSALPEHLPQGLQALDVSYNELTALPEHLPRGLQELNVNTNTLSALPEHLPQGLQQLSVSANELTALPEHLPQGLHELYVSYNKLSALPEHGPQGLQQLYVDGNELTALPERLPQGLQELNVSYNKLTVLPAHLPKNLKYLSVTDNGFNSKMLIAFMRSNTSITELDVDQLNIDAGAKQALDAELVNNMEHPARLQKAAVTLDLLTRFGVTNPIKRAH